MQAWKLPHLTKGLLTYLPLLNGWRSRQASTGGSDSCRYCYAVWLRHLVILESYGFKIKGAQVGELGPGDSIGLGMAALLSGAARYFGLDLVPFSAKTDLEPIFDDLVGLFSRGEPIPSATEFPRVRPELERYGFPRHIIDFEGFDDRIGKIRSELRTGMNSGEYLNYHAPWTRMDDIAVGSLDLVFSQAVLEHVDELEETYQCMSSWLKPGGFASHRIDFSAHYLSPHWNGHWAYSDWQWGLVRGRRQFLLNRQPLSTHLSCAREVGFEVLASKPELGNRGLPVESLSRRFRMLDAEDALTSGVTLILRKR